MNRRFLRLFVLAFIPAIVSVREGLSAESQGRLALIDLVIQEFSTRLGIPQEITFTLVAGNSSLVSVERTSPASNVFQLSFEEEFLSTLDDRDLFAAIAHEMGHVWIFTHFPYLHTESLANHYALKLVSQQDLDSVYAKVRLWKRHTMHAPGSDLK